MAPDLLATLGIDAKQYNDGMRAAAKEAVKTSKALEQLPKGTNAAAQSLQNLGRVAQDAPFGFIGIANNLNPLLESFQRLRQESGSTGGALKALGASLIGGGGIGLAFSAVTAAISFASIGLQAWGSRAKEAKKAAEDYVSSLDDVREAHLRGEQAAVKEITSLQLIYRFATDANKPLAERKKAVDELQKSYPSYFGNLTDEQILVGKVGSAYNELTAALLRSAQAEANRDLIVQNSKRSQEDQYKRLDAQAKLTEKIIELDKLNKADVATGSTDISAGQGLDMTLRRAELQSEINELFKTYNNLTTDQNKLTQRNLDLIKDVYSNAKKLSDLGGVGVGGTAAKGNNKRSFIDIGESGGGFDVRNQNMTTSTGMFGGEDAEKNLLTWQKAVNLQYQLADAAAQTAAELEREKLQTQQLTNILGQGLQSTFESIITGSQSAISAIGQFLQQLIAKLIAAAAAAAILAVILSAVGFGGGIGGAASSAGSFKNLFNSLSGFTAFADGGIVTSPTRALIGEGGEPEAVIPLSKLNKFVSNNQGGNMNGEFKVKGSDLILVLERANKTKSRTS